jgi:cell wall-associated NlpC family hydrolase
VTRRRAAQRKLTGVPRAPASLAFSGVRIDRYVPVALASLLAVAALAGCGEATSGQDPAHGAKARASGPARTPGVAVGVAGAAASAGAHAIVKEVADPEEAKSFPLHGPVHHAAAATPAKAGEVAIAPGAPSDAEVRQELAQMHAAAHSAPTTSTAGQQLLTPVPGGESIGGSGTIPIPTGVPEVVQKVVAGANEIADFPYVYGGGHASFVDDAYDCSGSVSYALAAGGLLGAPETSGSLESWGVPGPGRYITVYANAGHTYMYVDGILFDTAGRSGVYASRWQVGSVDNAGFVARHWPGL